ncbi:MAG TPA: hypothetical protein VM427_10750 [Patescibacteria group bacterium]|nr:hypothetical protein [Patescibacteria group bacterium]
MPIRVEIYGTTGVAIGVVDRSGRLREVLETGADLVVEGSVWHPLDGSAPRPQGERSMALDDILIAVADDGDDVPVHVQWHDIAVNVGPYRAAGQMATMPGFDPGRALARPTGEFVVLKDVRITLAGDPDGGTVTQAAALVNRYVVDRVEADIMLGFFFPGATMVMTADHERVAADTSRPRAPASGPSPIPLRDPDLQSAPIPLT